MRGFLLLVQFMTRIPIPKVEYDKKELGKAMKFFPVIGLIMGLILYGSFIGLSGAIEEKILIAILLLLIEIVLTGALHLDGLADTFDGIFSYRSKSRMLEIMKDSRVGTNGVLALVIHFMLKTVLIWISIEKFPSILVIMPMISRFESVLNATFGKVARPSGSGRVYIDNTKQGDFIFSLVFTAIVTFAVMQVKGIIILGITSLLAYYFCFLMNKKIGGVTGDTLGAVLELTGVITLLLGVLLG